MGAVGSISNELVLTRSALKETFARAEPVSLDFLVGVFLAITVGRHISMRMVVEKTPKGYMCRHTVWNLTVAVSYSRIQPAHARDVGDVYFMYFRNPLMRLLFCDEMRALPDGGLVGRIVILPYLFPLTLRYFAYTREA